MSDRKMDPFIVVLARQMRDDDIVHVGASQIDILLATELARRLWAPNLRVVAAGTYILSSGSGSLAGIAQSRTYARDVVASRQATFVQSRVFNDLHRSRVSFPGAMQVDMRGNANLIALNAGGRIIRGPGSGGLPTLTSHTNRFFVALRRHDARTLVEKVDRISVAGDPKLRENWGLPSRSLQQVITPIASFQSEPDGLQLIEATPGTSIAEIQQQTGFQIVQHANFCERSPPTAEEVDVLCDVQAKI